MEDLALRGLSPSDFNGVRPLDRADVGWVGSLAGPFPHRN